MASRSLRARLIAKPTVMSATASELRPGALTTGIPSVVMPGMSMLTGSLRQVAITRRSLHFWIDSPSTGSTSQMKTSWPWSASTREGPVSRVVAVAKARVGHVTELVQELERLVVHGCGDQDLRAAQRPWTLRPNPSPG